MRVLATSRALLAALTVLFVAPLTGVLTPSEASAQEVARLDAQIQVIVASSDGTGFDASLQPIAPNLTRQFSLFDSFRLDANHSLILRVGETRTVALPGGGEAAFELVSFDNGEASVRIAIPGGSSTITTRGGLVFVGGSLAPDGRIILAITT